MFTLGALNLAGVVLTTFGRPALLAQIASLVLYEMVFAALTYAAATAASGKEPNALNSIRAARNRIGTLVELIVRRLGAAFLRAITIIGIPLAIRILVRWWFGTQAVMLTDANAKQAISQSCRLVAGRWWPTAATILLVSVTFAGLITVVWIAGGQFASMIFGSALAVFLGPVAACFWTLWFLELTDTEEVIAATAPSAP